MNTVPICWICRDKANTCEHIFKKSLMKNTVGKQSYHVPFDGRNIKRIQGPDSKVIKYQPSICAQCNNDRSSKWDKAYSLFTEDYCFNYYKANEIDFAKIYGSNYTNGIRSLHCYFVKSLGCRIINSGVDLPDNFPNLLSSLNLSSLKISIHKNPSPILLSLLKEYPKINQDILSKSKRVLGKGELLARLSKTQSIRNYKVQNAIWWENIGDYQVNYWLNREADLLFGTPIEYNMPTYETTQHNLDLIEISDYMQRIL